MTCYIISYDLHEKPEQNYLNLIEAIKSYKTWARIVESTWAIVTDRSAANVRDYLQQFIADDDRLFVVKSGTEAAWHNVRCRTEWLKNNL